MQIENNQAIIKIYIQFALSMSTKFRDNISSKYDSIKTIKFECFYYGLWFFFLSVYYLIFLWLPFWGFKLKIVQLKTERTDKENFF